MNLLVNAAQAIPEGRLEAHEIKLTVRPHGDDRVLIAVRDTGSGIAPEILGRLFDPFFTTKPVGFRSPAATRTSRPCPPALRSRRRSGFGS